MGYLGTNGYIAMELPPYKAWSCEETEGGASSTTLLGQTLGSRLLWGLSIQELSQ